MKKTIAIFLVIVVIASAIRLYQLDLRPAHFDEGGGYAKGSLDLFRKGEYHYNPDFHGPFLFYATALSFHLFGINDVSLRLMEALFGIGLVLLVYPLRAYFKKTGFLVVALLIAISPSLVYYSRFALHDSFYVFFNLATVVSFFLYFKYKRDLYAYLFAISLALLFASKENVYIFLSIFSGYLLVEFLYSCKKHKGGFLKGAKHGLFTALKASRRNFKTIIVSSTLFLLVFSAMFTCFFKYPEDLQDAIAGPLLHWIRRSTKDVGGFYRPYSFYLEILSRYEFPIFFLGLGGILVFLKKNDPFTRFVSIWTLLTVIIYVWMPYKLPNNIIHAILPLAISSGLFVDFIFERSKPTGLYIILGVMLISSLYVSLDLNFVKYATEVDENFKPVNLLAFVQTTDDIKELLRLVDKAVQKHGKNIEIIVSVSQTEYPLSWYLTDVRNLQNVQYHSRKVDVPDGWEGINWEGDGKLNWGKDYAIEGRNIKIESVEGANANWRTKLNLKEGCYKLKAWVKSEQIKKVTSSGEFAKILVRKSRNNFPGVILNKSVESLGTNDWKEVDINFCLQKSEDVWISCVLANWGKAKGEIWFDNFSLESEKGIDYTHRIKNPNLEEGFKLEEFNAPIIIVSKIHGQTLRSRKGYEMKNYTLRPTVELAAYFKKGLVR